MSLFQQHSTYGQNIEVTVATSNLQTCSAGRLWQNRWTHLEWVESTHHLSKCSSRKPQNQHKWTSNLQQKGATGKFSKISQSTTFFWAPSWFSDRSRDPWCWSCWGFSCVGHRHGACSNDLSQQLTFQEKQSDIQGQKKSATQLEDLNTLEIRCTYKNACHATSFECQSNLQARRIQEARTIPLKILKNYVHFASIGLSARQRKSRTCNRGMEGWVKGGYLWTHNGIFTSAWRTGCKSSHWRVASCSLKSQHQLKATWKEPTRYIASYWVGELLFEYVFFLSVICFHFQDPLHSTLLGVRP